MRIIPIAEYDEHSMVLAKPLFDAKRRVLLAADHTIHPKYLERLMLMGITTLVVEDAISKGITLEEMLDMPTWMDVMAVVQLAYDAARQKKPLPVRQLQLNAGHLLVEVQRRPILVPMPTSLLAEELRPYAHAVNVALLALQVGRGLGYNQIQLRDLAIGCLLHDIGKVESDGTEHPETGFAILRKEPEFSLLSSHVAYQHHERMNGKGYPRGLANSEIHEYAQICGLVDYYENLISRDKTQPHEAMEMVMGQNEVAFSPKVVNVFVNRIPSYPPGTKVVLHSGEEAIVTRIDTHMQRPVVRILASEKEVSLADSPSILIAKVC